MTNPILEFLNEEAKKAAAQHGIFGSGNIPGQQDKLDAFRHAYISAIVTRRTGKPIAYVGGEAIEIGGDIINRQLEEVRAMDEHNNRIGRAIGQIAASDEEAAELVAKALRNGNLITAPFSESVDFSDFFPPIPVSKPTPPERPSPHQVLRQQAGSSNRLAILSVISDQTSPTSLVGCLVVVRPAVRRNSCHAAVVVSPAPVQ